MSARPLERLARSLARALGYELNPQRKTREPARQLVLVLDHARIDAVLDIGANTGQYARRLRRAGYAGPILSFEPLPQAHAALLEAAARDPAWEIAPRMAIGAETGTAWLEVAGESDMSSLLAQGELLRRISPSAAVGERIEVRLERLDGLSTLTARPWQRLHLKADVQGYEAAVLDGAAGLMERIATIQLELSLTPLYEGEPPWRAMVDRLAAMGFELDLIVPGYFERKIARHLQFDGVFVRRPRDC